MSTIELDHPLCQALALRFPGLTSAVDADGMAKRLQDALVGDESSGVVEACTPGKAFVEQDQCLIRYSLRLRDTGTGRKHFVLVTGRLFEDAETTESIFDERLAPLAERASGRDEIALLGNPIARLDSIGAVAYAFPIDPDIPTLIEATDPAPMKEVLARLVPAHLAPDLQVDDCDVAVAHYPRRHRCVLRYSVKGRSHDEESSLVVFGKVSDSSEPPTDGVLVEALRRELEVVEPHVRIPRFVGYEPALGLVLIEGIPGRPEIAPLLKTGAENGRGNEPLLNRTVETAGFVAARVHGCAARPRHSRLLTDEVAQLQGELRLLEPLDNLIATRLHRQLSGIVDSAEVTDGRVFSHGDFTPSQLLFEESRIGLIDFDNLCMAEPEMDLGQFCAYLGAATVKAQHAGGKNDGMSEWLRGRFLVSYTKTAESTMSDDLRMRVGTYERLSLVRMAVRAWRQLKPARAGVALTALERADPEGRAMEEELKERRSQ